MPGAEAPGLYHPRTLPCTVRFRRLRYLNGSQYAFLLHTPADFFFFRCFKGSSAVRVVVTHADAEDQDHHSLLQRLRVSRFRHASRLLTATYIKVSSVAAQCPGGESNSQALRHKILSLACLPVSPPGHTAEGRGIDPQTN